MTKKRAEQVHKNWLGNWTVRLTQMKEQRMQLECAKSASKCPTPVVHALVCSEHFCRDFESSGDASPPAFTSRTLEVEPLLPVPSLQRGLQTNGRRDDVDDDNTIPGCPSVGTSNSCVATQLTGVLPTSKNEMIWNIICLPASIVVLLYAH